MTAALEQTPRGRAVIYRASDGKRVERHPVEARELIASGRYVATPPAPPSRPLVAQPPRVVLPFEPTAVPVRHLPERLAEVDDLDVLHAMQRRDSRSSAAAHYERRIREIEAPPPPAPDPEPAEAEA